MLAKTHCLLALTVTSFALETAHPLTLSVAALASQWPDIDTSTSLAGRILWPLSRWLEQRFPHRTVTHSWLATAILALLTLPLRWHDAELWQAALLGYFGGWFGDAFTKAGVAAFYPLSSARLVIPANPRLRLATGSQAESVLCVILLLSLLASIHLHTQGGLRQTFNAWLAQPEGVTALFARASTTHQILAHIEGRFVASATPVKAEFVVLEVEGERLLVRDTNNTLYWAEHESTCAHCHLAIHRVQAQVGASLVIETRELNWRDEEMGAVIGGQWLVANKNKDQPPATSHQPPTTILFSGELTLRDADQLQVPTSLQHFNAIEVVGNPDEWSRYRKVRLRAATLNDLAPLHPYFGSGHLIIKIMQTRRP